MILAQSSCLTKKMQQQNFKTKEFHQAALRTFVALPKYCQRNDWVRLHEISTEHPFEGLEMTLAALLNLTKLVDVEKSWFCEPKSCSWWILENCLPSFCLPRSLSISITRPIHLTSMVLLRICGNAARCVGKGALIVTPWGFGHLRSRLFHVVLLELTVKPKKWRRCLVEDVFFFCFQQFFGSMC